MGRKQEAKVEHHHPNEQPADSLLRQAGRASDHDSRRNRIDREIPHRIVDEVGRHTGTEHRGPRAQLLPPAQEWGERQHGKLPLAHGLAVLFRTRRRCRRRRWRWCWGGCRGRRGDRLRRHGRSFRGYGLSGARFRCGSSQHLDMQPRFIAPDAPFAGRCDALCAARQDGEDGDGEAGHDAVPVRRNASIAALVFASVVHRPEIRPAIFAAEVVLLKDSEPASTLAIPTRTGVALA